MKSLKRYYFTSIYFFKDIDFFTLIHQNVTPPHMYTDLLKIGKTGSSTIDYSTVKQQLLPFPYETNCFDYQIKSHFYKSREDCIVKYFQRKEFNKCGCNRKWLYYNSENMTDVLVCSKSNKCRFDYIFDKSLLNSICPKNCFNEYYNSLITQDNNVTYPSMKFKKSITIKKDYEVETLIVHLAKMNLIQYFCSIGGLFSMWFGLSLFHLGLSLYGGVTHILGEYFQCFELGNRKRSILVRWIQVLKLKKRFKFVVILIYSTIMLIQISDVIRSYLNYETLIRFEINQKQINPRIVLGFTPFIMDLERLIEIYPEIERDQQCIDSIFEKDQLIRVKKFMKTCMKHLVKLIADMKFKELTEITFTDRFIKSCKLFKNEKIIDCSLSFNGLFMINNKIHMLTFSPNFNTSAKNLFEDKTCFEVMDKIELTLNGIGLMQLFLERCQSITFTGKMYFIDPNSITRIGFTSYSFRNLAHSENNHFKENCMTSRNEFFDNCYTDCLLSNLNEIYGCLPTFKYPLYIDFELHLISYGYRFCNRTINIANESSFRNKCIDICKPDSESIYFNTNYKTYKFSNNTDQPVVEIYPIKLPHIQYTETLNMDFNQLIYNCGGLLGLWFGLSPLSIDDLVINLRLSSNRLRFKILRIISIISVLLLKFIRLITKLWNYRKRILLIIKSFWIFIRFKTINILIKAIHLIETIIFEFIQIFQKLLDLLKRIRIYIMNIMIKAIRLIETIIFGFIQIFQKLLDLLKHARIYIMNIIINNLKINFSFLSCNDFFVHNTSSQ